MIEVVRTLQKFKLLNSSFLSQNWEKKISNENNYDYDKYFVKFPIRNIQRGTFY